MRVSNVCLYYQMVRLKNWSNQQQVLDYIYNLKLKSNVKFTNQVIFCCCTVVSYHIDELFKGNRIFFRNIF